MDENRGSYLQCYGYLLWAEKDTFSKIAIDTLQSARRPLKEELTQLALRRPKISWHPHGPGTRQGR
ncbi:hypothetical protein ANCDUO_13210, partial [Ancylostoma duodenale]